MLTMARTKTFGAAPTALEEAVQTLQYALDMALADPSSYDTAWTDEYTQKVQVSAEYIARTIGKNMKAALFARGDDVGVFINKARDILEAFAAWQSGGDKPSQPGKQTGYRKWIWILGGVLGVATVGLVVWRVRRKRGRR